MPKRFKQKGISRIQSVSEICDSEINALAWLAPNESANSGIALKLLMKGFAKPLVICNDTPSNIEKMKKIAIFFCLNSANAFKPRASTNDFFSLSAVAVGHEGRVNA